MSIESSKPRKQRKAFYDMPMHKRRKTLSGHLSPELRKTYGKRAIPIRTKDTVKIMRGSNKGKKGKVVSLNYKKRTLTIEGLVRKKSDGTDIAMSVQPSNVLIVTTENRNKLGKKGGK